MQLSFTSGLIAVMLSSVSAPGFAQTTETISSGQPFSAIDWLSESTADPQDLQFTEPEVSTGAAVESITVQSLDAPNPDATGLLPSSVTGFPASLWGNGHTNDIIDLINDSPISPLPALAALRRDILLAESRPPEDGDGRLLVARIDKMLALGLLEDARALMDSFAPETNRFFRRRFDVALLLGHENDACNDIKGTGAVVPSYQLRVFCLARNGDWNAAVLTLNSADVLGELEPGEYDLIARFLDPDMFEGDPDLPIPDSPTPLVYRMYEALGEPLATRLLPRAFSHADLRSTSGWKPRIEAAERLARVGAIADNRLLGIYTERQAAASGGVWDRVKTIQRFDNALTNRSVSDITQQLPELWMMMQTTGLERPVSNLFAPRLANLIAPKLAQDTSETPADPPLLFGDAALRAIWHMTLLSEGYETLLPAYMPSDGQDRFLRALTQGSPGNIVTEDPRQLAVQDGFDGSPLSPADQEYLNDDRVGELLLVAITRFHAGTEGDLTQITSALRILRSLGREDTARQASLQFLLMSHLKALR